jgi:hypothetical protein
MSRVAPEATASRQSDNALSEPLHQGRRQEQLPETMKGAMAKQAEAEREKRAKIINAEGEALAAGALGTASDIIMATRLRSSCETCRRSSRSVSRRTQRWCSPQRCEHHRGGRRLSRQGGCQREAVAHGTASRPRLGSPGALNDRWGRARVSGLDRRAGLFSAWGSGGACRIPRESWLGVEWLVWRRRRRSRR